MAYIPRSSLMSSEAGSAVPMHVRRRRTVRVFNFFGSFLLILSIVATAGLFFYSGTVNARLNDARIELDSVSSTNNESVKRKLMEIQIYDTKLSTARTLLNNHFAPSRLFTELESSTKETVQYTSFTYSYDPGFEATLILEGTTGLLSSVALQKVQIIKDSLFSNFVLSDINMEAVVNQKESDVAQESGTDKKENINFNLKGVLKKDLLEYTGKFIEPSSQNENSEDVVALPVNTDAQINSESI